MLPGAFTLRSLSAQTRFELRIGRAPQILLAALELDETCSCRAADSESRSDRFSLAKGVRGSLQMEES